jgi:hypothetical protein
MGKAYQHDRNPEFLGLARYYRRFIEGFSTIASPLTKLTRKEVRFVWSGECEASFRELKERLISAPELALPSGTEGLWYIVIPQKGV